ncbi:hypothetical protein D2T31_06860 [Sinirhodobacter populi]|uniref:Uncharacterized protein n=1 Tax=Paenirhodobacter populi TaxID=2306993 RepID=A0A443KDL8_9RHOB|nr:hypothetical protein [Sinirhodobacter populi]RWR30693.1 hypothetical protein D2T31_06860 [Sinirhodobacter populi]
MSLGRAVLTALTLALAGTGPGAAQTPAPAPQAPAPAAEEDEDTAQIYAYCAAMFGTLRKEQPAMVAGISPTVDQALRAEAEKRVPQWQMGLALRKAQMSGAGDARQLVGKRALLDRMKPEKDSRDVAVAFARCWELIQPWMRPGTGRKTG